MLNFTMLEVFQITTQINQSSNLHYEKKKFYYNYENVKYEFISRLNQISIT